MYEQYGSTFFYAYCYYPEIAYKMFQEDKTLSFIITNNCTVIEKMICEAGSNKLRNYTKSGFFLNIYKEKLKVAIYDYIIENKGYDYFINNFKGFFRKLFMRYTGENINFIEYVLSKEINEYDKEKVILMLKYRYNENEMSLTPIMYLMDRSNDRYPECILFVKKIFEIYPFAFEDKTYHPYNNNNKFVKAYHLAKIYNNKEMVLFIEILINSCPLKIKYK